MDFRLPNLLRIIALAVVVATSTSLAERDRTAPSAGDCPIAFAVANYRLKLAADDDDAWKHLVKFTAAGNLNGQSSTLFIPVLRQASPERRAAALKEIGQIYEAAVYAKNTQSWPAPSAKGGLDILLRHLSAADAKLGKDLLDRKPALRALGNYFRNARSFLPAESRVHKYNEKTVQNVALSIQNTLRSSNSKASVTLMGSFTNGRAVPGLSDIDIFSKQTLAPEILREIKKNIAELLEKANVGRLPVKDSVATDAQLSIFSTRSPVAIRVSPDKIEVLLYPLPSGIDADGQVGLLTPIVVRLDH